MVVMRVCPLCTLFFTIRWTFFPAEDECPFSVALSSRDDLELSMLADRSGPS